MYKAEAHCMLKEWGGGKEAQRTEKEHFILKFSFAALKYKFLSFEKLSKKYIIIIIKKKYIT